MSHHNPKNQLQERYQRIGLPTPMYATTLVGGIPQEPIWLCEVSLPDPAGGFVRVQGERTPGKRVHAELSAARKALELFWNHSGNYPVSARALNMIPTQNSGPAPVSVRTNPVGNSTNLVQPSDPRSFADVLAGAHGLASLVSSNNQVGGSGLLPTPTIPVFVATSVNPVNPVTTTTTATNTTMDTSGEVKDKTSISTEEKLELSRQSTILMETEPIVPQHPTTNNGIPPGLTSQALAHNSPLQAAPPVRNMLPDNLFSSLEKNLTNKAEPASVTHRCQSWTGTFMATILSILELDVPKNVVVMDKAPPSHFIGLTSEECKQLWMTPAEYVAVQNYLTLAFIHASFTGGIPSKMAELKAHLNVDTCDYQKLAYMGDSLQQTVVTMALFRQLTTQLDLTSKRVLMVREETCALHSDKLGLTGAILRGPYVTITSRMKAEVWEACLGVILLACRGDLEKASTRVRALYRRVLDPLLGNQLFPSKEFQFTALELPIHVLPAAPAPPPTTIKENN